ncbi:hypothetical protein [Streptomyces sp. NPDC005805]|uniref:hypothetical protein n=1 Tax=Streptomyces sp. NPDC005805 TaxID=3157068 RepID=UPI0034041F8E
MRLRGRIWRSAVVGAAATAMSIMGMATASASLDGPYVETPNGCASAWFQANGDKFWIGDWCADSASGAALWRVNLPCGPMGRTCPDRHLYNSKGSGTGHGVSINWTEDVPITYRACVVDRSASKVKTCSAYRGAVT